MKIADHRIVGAMVPPTGKAAFDRGPVVIASRSEPVRYFQVRTYIGDDEVEGKPVGPEDWQALVRAEQAIVIPPVDAASGIAFWVLRPIFTGREAALSELQMSGALLCPMVSLPDGSFGLLIREPAAAGMRDRWVEAASAEALSWAKSGRWEHARVAASRAFVVERAMSPERVAMLSLAHIRCGNTVGGEGYVGMARRSRGDAFAQRVLDRRAELERQVDETAPPSAPRLAHARDIYATNDNAIKAGIRRLRRTG